jgi:hypothetical protein
VSKSGDNYSTFGRILSDDVVKSNNEWFKEPFVVGLLDENYFEKNINIFKEKHTFGYKKLKNNYKTQFDENVFEYIIEPPLEII